MKVLANDGISLGGKLMLEREGFEVIITFVAQDQLANFINQNEIEVLLVRSATKVRQDLIDATNLKIIGRGGVGMDNIDVEYAQSKGIQVINTPEASSASVAEMVMAHVYSLFRNLHDANRTMPLEGETKFKELKKAYGKANELRGKTMGIIGFGRIGREVAKNAIGAGMKVIAYNRTQKEIEVPIEFFDGQKVVFKFKTQSFEDVLAQSDVISLHIPAQEKHIIGAEEIEKMKDGAMIINTARGGVVDEEALLEALDFGKIAGAGLDVFEDEPKPSVRLLMNEKISMSPHLAGSTEEAQERIGMELAEQITRIYKS
ncbi:MAG: NAD(P)-binding domain-containing protein [Flavobacteriaceae bacterium]|jgi:D-3-phosphoglycerate dehydrogenase|nr:NAD(P)-binding domain-containing protein [Flavobacteriaceae bacterium]